MSTVATEATSDATVTSPNPVSEPDEDEDEVVYVLTYLGEVLDVLDSEEDARTRRAELVRKIRAGELPDFLDPDDIEDVSDFPIRKGSWEMYR